MECLFRIEGFAKMLTLILKCVDALRNNVQHQRFGVLTICLYNASGDYIKCENLLTSVC